MALKVNHKYLKDLACFVSPQRVLPRLNLSFAKSSNRFYVVQLIDEKVNGDTAKISRSLGVTLSFVVGTGNAAQWLEDAILHCRKGEVLQLSNASRSLTRTVFMRHVSETRLDISPESLMKKAEDCLLNGNQILKAPVEDNRREDRKKYATAVMNYNTALNCLALASCQGPGMVTRLRLNIALANLKLQLWESTAAQCDAVLTQDPHNTKALYRRAKAAFERGQFEPAIVDLKSARLSAPSDPGICGLLSRAINKQYASVQQGKEHFTEIYKKRLVSPLFEKQSFE